MKRNPLALLWLLISFIAPYASAQVVFEPLGNNPVLSQQALITSSVQRIAAFDDTLLLPFRDDFARQGVYPFDSLWLDSGVFINNNYSQLPVTIGIATFDGLDKFGRPYRPSSNFDSVADVLTSRPLDLVVPPNDTSVWLTFFYQPQGLGDVPEAGDSLVLQFKDTGNVWHTVWAVDGRPDTAFQRVDIRIDNPIFLFRGFQFRFYNIATVNGNRDHWNLDYVLLLKNSIPNAPILDNALIRPQSSLLKEFSAMPYTHYKSLSLSQQQAAMKTSIEDTIYNIDYGGTSYQPVGAVLQNGVVLTSGIDFASASMGNSYIPFSIPLNSWSYPSLSTDSADFLVRSNIDQHSLDNVSDNDTSYYLQHFHNYYAYDDGSAEIAFGLSGSQNVSRAVGFDVKMQDTLRGVQIYFNPTGENITNKLFQLTVWSDINVGTNTDVELYRLINQKPDSFDGINAFKTYLFDSTLVVGPGTIWVGFIQNDPQTLYGVGFDRNTDSHDKIVYRLAGSWSQQNIINGSLMIRPIFGKSIPTVSVSELKSNAPEFIVSPNPANEKVFLQIKNERWKNLTYQVFDILGVVIAEKNINQSTELDISGLQAGIYFIRLINSDSNSASVQKLIIR